MTGLLRFRLSVMMFLEYFIWGSWYVTTSAYASNVLNFTKGQIGMIYSTTAIAAIISPFFVGMVADRFFRTERVLALLHILGGLFLYGVATSKEFSPFYYLLLAHTLCYMPTLALTNSLTFHHVRNPEKDFPLIRVLGTISWIVANLTVNQAFGELAVKTPRPLYLAAGTSLLMGLYCLTLPKTPPPKAGEVVTLRDVLGLDALKMVRDVSFAVFIVGAFLFCIPLSFYFSFGPAFLVDLGISNVPAKTTLGQMSEIFFLLVMPWFLVRLGVKKMLLIGMAAWATRYLCFAYGDNVIFNSEAAVTADQILGALSLLALIYFGIVLHGVCYDFFFVTAYIYTDRKASKEIRAKAQGLIALVTLGLGMFFGARLSGLIVGSWSFPKAEPVRVKRVVASDWTVGGYAAWSEEGRLRFGELILLIEREKIPGNTIKLIKDPRDGWQLAPENAEKVIEVELPKIRSGLVGVVEVYDRQAQSAYAPTGQIAALPTEALSKPLPNWRVIWQIPAIFSLIIMVPFGLLFSEQQDNSA